MKKRVNVNFKKKLTCNKLAKSCVRKLHFSTLPECKSKPVYGGTSENFPMNSITKLETKFAENEKNIGSRENKLQLDVSNQSS